MHTLSYRIQQCFLQGLVVLLLGIHLWHGLHRGADPDEFQVLVNAYHASRGLEPYVQYWDNHGPLNIWLLTPILAAWHGGHELIQWLRILPWINTVLLCVTIALFTRRCYPEYRLVPWISMIFLLSAPSYLAKSLEIRSDNPANHLAAISLFSILMAVRERRAWLFIIAGLAIGLISGFTLKFLAIGLAMGCGLTGVYYQTKAFPRLKEALYGFLGFCLPIGLMSFVLITRHSWEAFLICYFDSSTSRPLTGIVSSELTEVFAKATAWSLLAMVTCLAAVVRILKRSADEIETALLLIVLVIVSQFIFLMPTKYMQSLLPLYVPLAILAGLSANRFFVRIREKPWWRPLVTMPAAVLILSGLFLGLWRYCDLDNRQLAKQINFADDVMASTEREKHIFDPTGIVFLKSKPGPFPVMITYIRNLTKTGLPTEYIPGILELYHINSVIYDRRTADLSDETERYLREYYVPVFSGPQSLLLQSQPSAVASVRTSKILNYWRHNSLKTKSQAAPLAEATWLQKYLKLYRKNKPVSN